MARLDGGAVGRHRTPGRSGRADERDAEMAHALGASAPGRRARARASREVDRLRRDPRRRARQHGLGRLDGAVDDQHEAAGAHDARGSPASRREPSGETLPRRPAEAKGIIGGGCGPVPRGRGPGRRGRPPAPRDARPRWPARSPSGPIAGTPSAPSSAGARKSTSRSTTRARRASAATVAAALDEERRECPAPPSARTTAANGTRPRRRREQDHLDAAPREAPRRGRRGAPRARRPTSGGPPRRKHAAPAAAGRAARPARITRSGSRPPGSRHVRRGSSARTVPAPTSTASETSRSPCASRRAAGPVIQRASPPARGDPPVERRGELERHQRPPVERCACGSPP